MIPPPESHTLHHPRQDKELTQPVQGHTKEKPKQNHELQAQGTGPLLARHPLGQSGDPDGDVPEEWT